MAEAGVAGPKSRAAVIAAAQLLSSFFMDGHSPREDLRIMHISPKSG